MVSKAVTPSEVLSDSENFVDLDGVVVRKGSIAAFLKNIDVLESTKSSEDDRSSALDMLKQLAPAIIASGLTRHVSFRSSTVREILSDEN